MIMGGTQKEVNTHVFCELNTRSQLLRSASNQCRSGFHSCFTRSNVNKAYRQSDVGEYQKGPPPGPRFELNEVPVSFLAWTRHRKSHRRWGSKSPGGNCRRGQGGPFPVSGSRLRTASPSLVSSLSVLSLAARLLKAVLSRRRPGDPRKYQK